MVKKTDYFFTEIAKILVLKTESKCDTLFHIVNHSPAKTACIPPCLSSGLCKKLFLFIYKAVFIVATKKKTFYEILAISPNATQQEIQASYDSLIIALKSQQKLFKPEDYDAKLKMIALAFNMLSIPASRDAYDAELAANRETRPDASASKALTLRPDADTLSLKAEALALRAEAMSLRADALSMKSDIGAFGNFGNYQGPGASASAGPMSFLKKFAMFLGFLAAAWMVIQVLFLLVFNRNTGGNSEMAARAEEKMIIQEYYQTHGVRAKNRAEVELLQAEERRKNEENRQIEREAYKAERDKEKAETAARRFEEEARQRADQVSAELRYAENKAREQAEREEAQKTWKQEEEKRKSEQAERYRIEREKEKWRETLRR